MKSMKNPPLKFKINKKISLIKIINLIKRNHQMMIVSHDIYNLFFFGPFTNLKNISNYKKKRDYD